MRGPTRRRNSTGLAEHHVPTGYAGLEERSNVRCGTECPGAPEDASLTKEPPMKKRAGKDFVRTQVACPRSHVAHPCKHHQEATRHQSTSSLSMKVNELHLACPPHAIGGQREEEVGVI